MEVIASMAVVEIHCVGSGALGRQNANSATMSTAHLWMEEELESDLKLSYQVKSILHTAMFVLTPS